MTIRLLKAGVIIIVLAAVHFCVFFIATLAYFGDLEYPLTTPQKVTTAISAVLGFPALPVMDLLERNFFPTVHLFVANSLLWGTALYAILGLWLQRRRIRFRKLQPAIESFADGGRRIPRISAQKTNTE